MGSEPHWALTQTIAPSAEPVEVADILAHSRIWTEDAEETYLSALITTARRWVEEYTGRQLITATWRFSLDCFPVCMIRLPRAPIQAVGSITYTDPDGTSQTWAASNYQVDTEAEPGRVMPAYGEVWPSIRSGVFNAVQVTYTAGYGATKDDVPQDLRHAIMLLVAHLHEHREATMEKALQEIPFGVKALADMYRIQWFGGWT